MNLNYTELKQSCNHIEDSFQVKDRWYGGKVQKVFSSGNLLILSVRIPSKTLYLTIGRGNEFCGVWLSDKQIPSSYRIQRDQFLEYIRSNTMNKRIVSIVIDEKDKCICISFHDETDFLFFFKGRRLHFTHLEKSEESVLEFSPWNGLKICDFESLDKFDVFNKAGRKLLDSKKEGREINLELELDGIFDTCKEDVKKSKKKLRKISLIENDLLRCSVGIELQGVLINEEIDLSKDKYTYKSFKIKFDPSENDYQRRDKIFKKIKRLKRGVEILEKRLVDEKEKIVNSEIQLKEQKIIFPLWNKGERKEVDVVSKNNEAVFLEYGSIKIAIGLSSKSNDRLRKEWAKKQDLWFHIEFHKSSHLFIKGVEQVGYETAQLLGSLLAEYSKFEKTDIPIIYTKVAYLKGVKGSQGMVNYKKEKHLVVERVNWKEIISSHW